MDVNWKMTIELEFPVMDSDTQEISFRDTEHDFSDRALRRIRRYLENLITDSPFEHYHVVDIPTR